METCIKIELDTIHSDQIKSEIVSTTLNEETCSNNIGPNTTEPLIKCEITASGNSENTSTADNIPNLNDVTKLSHLTSVKQEKDDDVAAVIKEEPSEMESNEDVNGVDFNTNVKSEFTGLTFVKQEESDNAGLLNEDQLELVTTLEVQEMDIYANINTQFNDLASVKQEVSDEIAAWKQEQSELEASTEMKEIDVFSNVNTQSSLSQLLEYGLTDTEDSDSDSHDTATDSEINENVNESTNLNNKDKSTIDGNEFRNNGSESSSTSEYESDSSSSCSDIGACAVTPISEKKKTGKMNTLRTRGELGIEDLPPIEELKISVPEQECIQMGIISSIIDQLVIVQSLPGLPAYDIDTLLFLNSGKQALGKVFDVLGPVTEPFYAVRFNSYEQAIETGAKPGIPVYCSPARHTSYVFVSELMKIRGSDASWEHNNEPPVMFLDFSDDEEERKARRVIRNRANVCSETHKTNSLERNKKFEKQMNDKNLLMNEHFKNQPVSFGKRAPEPNRNPQVTNRPTLPPPWPVQNPPMPRPDFWSTAPYQFGYQYRPVPVFPNVGVRAPRQTFVPPMMAPHPPPAVFHTPAMPFNPTIPPPMMAPPAVSFFPNPRHPRWVTPGLGVLQPPRGNMDNGPYSQ